MAVVEHRLLAGGRLLGREIETKERGKTGQLGRRFGGFMVAGDKTLGWRWIAMVGGWSPVVWVERARQGRGQAMTARGSRA